LPFTNHRSDLGSWDRLKRTWFSHFWGWFGPGYKPLFAGNVRPVLEKASGVVLDIGPGNGVWMDELAAIVEKDPGKISKIYGIEPNVHFHPQLRNKAKRYGLEDIYEPIDARAEDLEKKGIPKASVDTIITVHVLCSVGHHANDVVKDLYEYLKPGGQWLVFEHVASKHAPVKLWQSIHNTVWPQILDGCDLLRDTEETLKTAGEWESVDLGPAPTEGYFESLPHVVGTLVKKL